MAPTFVGSMICVCVFEGDRETDWSEIVLSQALECICIKGRLKSQNPFSV